MKERNAIVRDKLIPFVGRYKIDMFDTTGKYLGSRVEHNVITQGFYTSIWEFMNQSGSAPDVDAMNLTHMATGTGTNPALLSDTQLQTEFFRKPLSNKYFSNNVFTCKLVLNPDESNITIREIGIFAKATDTANSGLLISRCNFNVVKNENIQYIITYTMTRRS
jgi:hypothetical protein